MASKEMGQMSSWPTVGTAKGSELSWCLPPRSNRKSLKL